MERLQKVMAHSGVASRRKCENLIEQGRVKVNGQVVTELGTKVSPSDFIEVDGKVIFKEDYRYILLHKPAGVITSTADEKDRQVITDLLPEIEERIYPIGRLDYDTTGLILLTNDGEFANLMMHPKYEISKEYEALVEGIIENDQLNLLRRGVDLDGVKTSPAKARLLNKKPRQQTSRVRLEIHEGWNHQVKRMFEVVGHPVQRLKRVKISFLELGKLETGMWRELSAFEVDKLKKIAFSAQDDIMN